MKKILVSIDFSDCSINALEHALVIAEKLHFDIKMLWVESPDIQRNVFYEPDNKNTYKKVAKDKLNDLAMKYSFALTNGKLDYTIRKGKVYEEVVREANEINAFMIIAGTHGASGFEELWLGSNANKIVTMSKTPVLTIRLSPEINRVIKKIVMPIDDSLISRQKAPITGAIAEAFNSEVHILEILTSKTNSVIKKVKMYSKQAKEYFDKENICSKIIEGRGNNFPEITISYAESINADLVTTVTEQEPNAFGFFLGKGTAKLVHHCPTPVLSIHSEELMRIVTT